ncbi:MAG: multiheme c-type cytochrome [Polyangiaceae bacterium]
MLRRCLLVCSVAPLFVACGNDAPKVRDQSPVFTAEELMNPELCRTCHEGHYDEWSNSMHAYASRDPVFLAMNRRGIEETGGALGDFCVRCHAPLAVRTGATVDGSNLESLPASLQGVTCYFCHNASRVEGTHNNPVQLDANAPLTLRAGISRSAVDARPPE